MQSSGSELQMQTHLGERAKAEDALFRSRRVRTHAVHTTELAERHAGDRQHLRHGCSQLKSDADFGGLTFRGDFHLGRFGPLSGGSS